MRPSLVRPSPSVAESRTKSRGKRDPTRSSSVLVKKLVAGRDVPYLLCRCRVAINWAEFTAVEKRHTANIIHRTRPVISCRFAVQKTVFSRGRGATLPISREISPESNEFDPFSPIIFAEKFFPSFSNSRNIVLDHNNRAYLSFVFPPFVESKFYLERERNTASNIVFAARRISLLSTSIAITRINLV